MVALRDVRQNLPNPLKRGQSVIPQNWKAIALICLCYSISLKAAELVEIPEGIMVRGIEKWDREEIEIRTAGQEQKLAMANGVASHIFSKSSLCQDAAYRTNGGVWISLSAYCVTKKPELMSFLFISDSQEFHEQHRLTARLLKKTFRQNPSIRFTLISGDLVHWGNGTEWKNFREVATSEYSSEVPIVPVVGNHEFYLDPSLSYWRWLYEVDSNKSRYYRLEYPLFSLLVLDSNVEWLSESSKQKQTDWLEEQLRTGEGTKPVFVTFHHPGYSSGKIQFALPLPPTYVKKYWHPLFKKYGVRGVFNGHDHIYQRLIVDGVNYIIAGPAGGSLSEPAYLSPYANLTISDERTVSLLSVNDRKQVRLQTWSVGSEKLIDDYTF